MQNKSANEITSKLCSSIYARKDYKISFEKTIAEKYLPIIFKNKCISDDPQAVYYRIVIKNKPLEYCIQYYYYWKYQTCVPSHKHDYEPIFVYLEPSDDFPSKIVNGGYHYLEFHKNEIRPREGTRSKNTQRKKAKISESPFYPFGKYERKSKEVLFKTYPLKGRKKDLTFSKHRPKFGIRICSNVFSGAKHDLNGRKFKPKLQKLTDKVLDKWYFKNYTRNEDMPFGHDVSSPFTFPYINYRDARPHLKKPKDFVI